MSNKKNIFFEDKVTKSGLKIEDFISKGTATLKCGLKDTFTANIPTKLVVLTNKNDMEVCITNLGARIVSIMAKTKNDNFIDVVLGLSSIEDYADVDNKNNVFGAAVGPVIGRISNASYTYDGVKYELEKNWKGVHTLHSGKYGWQYQTWTVVNETKNSVTLNLVCPDMEAGFPGERNATIVYTLTDNNEVKIDYKISTDKATPINISNHSYFNLSGNLGNANYNDKLQIFSDKLVCVDKDICPTGKINQIKEGSVPDFYTKAKKLIKNVDVENEYFMYTQGYDFPYVFDNKMGLRATLYNDTTGILMETYSNRPVLNLYDAHDLNGSIVGKDGIAYGSRTAICLECQNFADAVNHPSFYNSIITPKEDFESTTIYKFSVK